MFEEFAVHHFQMSGYDENTSLAGSILLKTNFVYRIHRNRNLFTFPEKEKFELRSVLNFPTTSSIMFILTLGKVREV